MTLFLVHRTAGGRGGLLCSRQERVRGWFVRAVVEDGESMNVENIPGTRIKCIIISVEISKFNDKSVTSMQHFDTSYM